MQRAVIPFLTAGELKGTAYALYYLLLGACSLVANFLFGALWDQVSSTAAFSYSLVTSLAAVVGLTVLTFSWGKTRSAVSVANYFSRLLVGFRRLFRNRIRTVPFLVPILLQNIGERLALFFGFSFSVLFSILGLHALLSWGVLFG